jgi:two-component system, OmpR family, phosphate regulon response regulator PhoB
LLPPAHWQGVLEFGNIKWMYPDSSSGSNHRTLAMRGLHMIKRILIVDDEVGARTLIGIMLDRGGFKVSKAKDANEALSLLEKEGNPDMIILDVMMPGMDGIELCRQIRKRTNSADIPILILSARGDAESVMRGMDAGATDYIPKPILHHDLVAKVRQLLNLNTVAE